MCSLNVKSVDPTPSELRRDGLNLAATLWTPEAAVLAGEGWGDAQRSWGRWEALDSALRGDGQTCRAQLELEANDNPWLQAMWLASQGYSVRARLILKPNSHPYFSSIRVLAPWAYEVEGKARDVLGTLAVLDQLADRSSTPKERVFWNAACSLPSPALLERDAVGYTPRNLAMIALHPRLPPSRVPSAWKRIEEGHENPREGLAFADAVRTWMVLMRPYLWNRRINRVHREVCRLNRLVLLNSDLR